MDAPQLSPSTSPAPLLWVEGLNVEYSTAHGVVKAVHDVDLSVAAGERVAIVGESGSGKTNVCLAVAGFVTQVNSRVFCRTMMFDTSDLSRVHRGRLPRRIPGLAMIFQDAMNSLDPLWTIGQQLRSVLRATSKLKRREVDSAAKSWLHKVGLTDTDRVLGARPYELSGGMRQRAMIALALCGQPRLVIADEPTSALDASLSREVMQLLVSLTDELGTGLVIVSHDIELCRQFADRIVVMYGGGIVETGATSSLRMAAHHPYTQGLFRSVPTLESATLAELPTIPMPTGAGQHDPEGGCPFRPRCPAAHARCMTTPPLMPLPDSGAAACWLLTDDQSAPDERSASAVGVTAERS